MNVVVNGVVVLSETSSWELEIDRLEDDTRNASLILNKRFLSCIDDKRTLYLIYLITLC
jgi:hypothetical protein